MLFRFLFAFLLVSLLASYFTSFNQKGHDAVPVQAGREQVKANQSGNVIWYSSNHIQVEIWSKAAIGQYVWENVLRGSVDRRHSGLFYIEGSTEIDNVTFTFRSGPSLKLPTLQSFSVPNLILIFNWRDQEKIDYSIPWLDAIVDNDGIRNVGIIALGNEKCDNEWFLLRLLASKKIKFLFIVYDWDLVDNKIIYQWPLGIATYRHFPASDLSALNLQISRPYLCNFIATVYANSSRQELVTFFERNLEFQKRCLVNVRNIWKPQETQHSLDFYVKALKLSDLTLSPIGLNHECYRILEAVEYGSVPVIERNQEHLQKKGNSCDRQRSLRLFQELDAPFIYVTDWTHELPFILKAQLSMTEAEKATRRIELIKWYHRFKIVLKNRLVGVIRNKFT